jgi:hypothetical protein
MPRGGFDARVRRCLAALLLALASSSALAQSQRTPNFVFSPENPLPGDNVTVFIRTVDSVNGFVLCPEAARIITAVRIEGASIILDLWSLAPAGGFVRPYCDGNTVSLGRLPEGVYSVTARFVLPDGRIGPTLLSAVLAVGALPVPAIGPVILAACAVLLVLAGIRSSGARKFR